MKSGRARAVGIGTLLFGILLISGMAAAQSNYGSNVTVSKTTTVNISSNGGASVDNTGTTGVSATISGLSGVSSAVVTTQSLSGPSTGVGTFSTSGTAAYFDLSVTLPAGTSAGSATVTVCFTNSAVTSSDTLYYWSGSAWTAATSVSSNPPQICGTVPLSALTGTNFVAAPPAAADYTWVYVTVVLLIIIIIAAAIILRRRSKKSP